MSTRSRISLSATAPSTPPEEERRRPAALGAGRLHTLLHKGAK
ncbi:hypothetical protein ACWCY1_33690 [Streptomyces goshikiensis]|nr:hypothetical protein [Streptomyces goshikiensis]